ncbi:hypothetical protein Gorai_007669 [Gossypium raimondii]|uniref:Uncharacterized protein n=1 Tax=Gossypium raimondii TaxID=29730 RepID=A0A7J8Q8G4_GOSRA|nr:hypothetical protein [Gossypium raimondii]
MRIRPFRYNPSPEISVIEYASTLCCFLILILVITTGNFECLSCNMGYLNSVLQSSSQVHAEYGPVSGGGLSQNGKFSYGYASSPGKRSSMEDFYETRIDGVDGEIVGLFGVFDVAVLEAISHGLLLAQDSTVVNCHGGARAAEYVKQNLFSNLIRHPKFISDTKSAIGYSRYDCI